MREVPNWGRVVSSQFYHRSGSGNNIAGPPVISSHFENMDFIIAQPPDISSHFDMLDMQPILKYLIKIKCKIFF